MIIRIIVRLRAQSFYHHLYPSPDDERQQKNKTMGVGENVWSRCEHR
jgi:hypothetical protein